MAALGGAGGGGDVENCATLLIEDLEAKKTLTFHSKSTLDVVVCLHHPAAPGSNPKHTMYAFSICNITIVSDIGIRNEQK